MTQRGNDVVHVQRLPRFFGQGAHESPVCTSEAYRGYCVICAHAGSAGNLVVIGRRPRVDEDHQHQAMMHH